MQNRYTICKICLVFRGIIERIVHDKEIGRTAYLNDICVCVYLRVKTPQKEKKSKKYKAVAEDTFREMTGYN